ncbi:hypothetical protein O9929_21030 [Vibrio lentus]|nr:hypothetical protein [Vibrio lentus]
MFKTAQLGVLAHGFDAVPVLWSGKRNIFNGSSVRKTELLALGWLSLTVKGECCLK